MLPLVVANCAREMNTHGWEDLEQHKKEIIVGTMTTEDVQKLLGNPTAMNLTLGKEWYYVQLIEEGFSIAKPKIKTHKMLKIAFNEKNIVKAVSIEDIQPCHVPFVKEKTKTSGYEEGFLKDTFGRFGQR